MSDRPEKQQIRWLKGVAALCLLLLAALLLMPFLLTTQLVRLALGQVFPDSRPSVGRAILSPSGTLVLHDLALHEAGTLAEQPLLTARRVHVAFGWTALLARQIRRIHVDGVAVYARANGPSPLSLLDLWGEQAPPGPPAGPKRDARPIWIDTLDLQGMIHLEPITGLVAVRTDWPLALQMTMSGDPLDPSHQFRLAVGETHQLPKDLSEMLAVATPEPVPRARAAFGLLVEGETQPAAWGMRVIVHRLATSQVSLTIEAETLRQHVPTLPPELQGRIDTSLRSLWASGELDLSGPDGQQLVGSLAFAGLRLRVPGRSALRLNIDDLTGTAKIDTPVPPGPQTRITLERLQAKTIKAAIDAGTLHPYATKLPAELRGAIDIELRGLEVSGLISPAMGEGMGLSGQVRLQDLSARSAAGDTPAFALDRLNAAADVEAQLHPWTLTALKVRHGMVQWATLHYHTDTVYHLDASWELEDQMLRIEHAAAEIFGGYISGILAWDLETHAIPQCDVQLKSINMHAVLANLSPEHVDAEGSVSGFLHMGLSEKGELSGRLDLAFDGPGLLRISEMEELKQMLIGNVGLALATLALQDLQQYPFTEGRLSLESMGKHSELKVKFVRRPRSEADVTPPHKEIINGQEVWVGSLIVPVIDMTIPIIGKSLTEILAIVSGVRPRREAVSQPHGK